MSESLEDAWNNFPEHSVVVGKFIPHNGHIYLCQTAIIRSKFTSIFVIDGPGDSPTAEVRANWLRTILNEWDEYDGEDWSVQVVPNLPPGNDDNSEAWADYTIKLLDGKKPDAVFTSEQYGETWAEALGCRHICVDLERKSIPVSGTLVRKNPQAVWDMIPEVVRPHYVKKILIIGPESTGKTTLAMRLAEEFRTVWVEEYGRIHVEKYGVNTDDLTIFPMIMVNQPRMEDEAAKKSPNGIIFCDTDLLTTSVWYEAWRGKDSMWQQIKVAGQARRYDLVFYCDWKDVPWVDDGTRTEKLTRSWFGNQLQRMAYYHDSQYTFLTGDWEERFDKAVSVTTKYLETLNGK